MSHNPSARALGGAGTIVVALFLAIPQSGATQQAAATAHDPPSVARPSAADGYRRKAERLYGEPARWAEVIDLRLDAARAAAQDDPMRVEDLWMAGVLSARMGRLDESVRHLEGAATAALEFGDPARAAQAYVLAAGVAAELGHRKSVDHLVLHARMLRNSGLLGAAECDCLDQRMAMLTGVKVPPGES